MVAAWHSVLGTELAKMQLSELRREQMISPVAPSCDSPNWSEPSAEFSVGGMENVVLGTRCGGTARPQMVRQAPVYQLYHVPPPLKNYL
jgi:hypothetical protein